MTYKEIYSRILPLWPDSINISDAVIIEPKPANKKNQLLMPSRANSFYSKNLSDAWTKARDAAASETIAGQLMIWTIYQLLSRKAQENVEAGIAEIKPAELNRAELEEQFHKNLIEEEMTEELEKYDREVG